MKKESEGEGKRGQAGARFPQDAAAESADRREEESVRPLERREMTGAKGAGGANGEARAPDRAREKAKAPPLGEAGGETVPDGEGPRFSYGTQTERQLFCHDGIPLVEARLTFPVFGEEIPSATSRFYERLRAAGLAYAQGELFALSRARLESAEGRGARYFHRRLVLVHTATLYPVGEFLCIRRERRVEYRGHVLTAERFGEVLDGEGNMRSPRAFSAAGGMGRRLLCGWQRMGFLLDREGHAILPQ